MIQRIAGAFSIWALAILGAIGVAVWLKLAQRDSMILIIAVALVAFFGAFLPIVRLNR